MSKRTHFSDDTNDNAESTSGTLQSDNNAPEHRDPMERTASFQITDDYYFHHSDQSDNEKDDDAQSSTDSDTTEMDEEMVMLKHNRHERMASAAFGIKPTFPLASEKSERSLKFREVHAPVTKFSGRAARNAKTAFAVVGNCIYTICFGWWIALLYFIVGLLLLATILCHEYGRKCFELGLYYLFPFGKYLERDIGQLPQSAVDSDEEALLVSSRPISITPSGSSTHQRASASAQSVASAGGAPDNTASASSSQQSFNYYYHKNTALSTGTSGVYSASAINAQAYSYTRQKPLTTTQKAASIIFMVVFAPILSLGHLLLSTICWLLLGFIPAAKVNFEGMKLLFKDPITIKISSELPPPHESQVLLFPTQAFSFYMYKYEIYGVRVILLNLMLCVLASIFFFVYGHFVDTEFVERNAAIVFSIDMLATVPLAYFIGKAVSNIAAQSSFAVGAILNVSFSSLVELIIYINAISKGLSEVAQQAITGSLLANILLLPGVSMLFGGVKHKELKFNQTAAGVSSVLLLLCVVGSFSPTIFYQLYGSYELQCGACTSISSTNLTCSGCTYIEKDYEEDPIYIENVRPLMYACAAVLPIAYFFGLLFSLKTHAHIYEDDDDDDDAEKEIKKEKRKRHAAEQKLREAKNQLARRESSHSIKAETPVEPPSHGDAYLNIDDEHAHHNDDEKEKVKQGHGHDHGHGHGHGHGAPAWSRKKSIGVLVVATLLYGIVSESLTEAMTPALDAVGINPEFAGLTLLAVIPNIGEILNSIRFAMKGDISLSLEIGNAGAIQICLFQLPFLVAVSAIFFASNPLTLIFPSLDLFTIVFSVLIINYISIDGRSNYFEGASLVIIYIIIITGFYFVPHQL